MQQSHVMRNFQIMKKLKLLLHLSAYTTTTYVASFAIKLFQKNDTNCLPSLKNQQLNSKKTGSQLH